MGVLEELSGVVLPEVELEFGEGEVDRVRSSRWVDGEFLCGPIPLEWLGRACGLSGGSTLAVGLAVWWLVGVKGGYGKLKLTAAIAKRFALTPSSKSRGLAALEAAGLVLVERRPRKNPLVTVLLSGNG